MKLRANQAGFSPVELIIVLVVVAALGFVGYSVYNRQQDQSASNSGTSQQAADEPATANDVKSAPTISSTGDLDKANTVLDQTDPGGSNNTDASQLDSELATF